MSNEQTEAIISKQADQIRELSIRVERLERIIDGFGELMRPSPKAGNTRLTRWMKD